MSYPSTLRSARPPSSSTGRHLAVQAGRDALAYGGWEEARICFDSALKHAESPEALEGLGMACWWLEDYATGMDAPGSAPIGSTSSETTDPQLPASLSGSTTLRRVPGRDRRRQRLDPPGSEFVPSSVMAPQPWPNPAMLTDLTDMVQSSEAVVSCNA